MELSLFVFPIRSWCIQRDDINKLSVYEIQVNELTYHSNLRTY